MNIVKCCNPHSSGSFSVTIQSSSPDTGPEQAVHSLVETGERAGKVYWLRTARPRKKAPLTCYERADFVISWSTLSAASAISYTSVLSPGFLTLKMILHI